MVKAVQHNPIDPEKLRLTMVYDPGLISGCDAHELATLYENEESSVRADTLFLFGPQVVLLVVFSKRTNVHVENGTIQISVRMFLGDHGIFNSVHTTDRRTVIVALITAANTL